MEIWKDIQGYEGFYQISNYGKVKSLGRWRDPENSIYWVKEKILSRKANPNQYITVALSKYGKLKTFRIHRLVAEAFIPKSDNRTVVNHKDLNKQNNHVNNLEWVTPRENVIHAIKHKPSILDGMIRYNKYVRPKDVLQYTKKGKLINIYKNATEASKATGVCQRNICQVANKEEFSPGRTRKQAGGYIWRYREEINENEGESVI